MTKVLVIGGCGVFGQRLVAGLLRNGFDVVIAGRDLDRARQAAARWRASFESAQISAIRLNTETLTPGDLEASGAVIVADAAGPFQQAEPRTARAAIAAGLHYVDLADARDFVCAFPKLDESARTAGVVAVSGCSSTPALSNAVLDHLTRGWTERVDVEAAISPGARASRGRSVMQATLSWLGRPVQVYRGGRWRQAYGWQGLQRRDFSSAGPRWLSLCETPDLDLFVQRFKPSRSAVFLAGLEPGTAHFATWVLGWVVRLGLLDARKYPVALVQLGRLFTRSGNDRGAMRVAAYGRNGEGRAVRAVWRLVAEPGAGPVTPSLPALAVIKAIAAGQVRPGARACVGVVSLSALEAEIAAHPLTTEQSTRRAALFARALGPSFDTLPPAILNLHETPGPSVWRGEARTEGAVTPLARVIAKLFGFPASQDRAEVVVDILADGRQSVWRRRIGGQRFSSVLGHARSGGRITERFGPFTFDLVLEASSEALAYRIDGWRIGPLRLPSALAPRTATSESVDLEGRFVFDVDIALPWGARLVRYRGWLCRSDANDDGLATPAETQ